MTIRASLMLSLLVLLMGCSTPTEIIPETGRERDQLEFSEEEMARLGESGFKDVLAEEKVTRSGVTYDQLLRIGMRLAKVTGKDYDWEFALIESGMINAFCLPGGKVGVYRGILPVCENEDGLAVILAHEIAHATLQHSNEKLSDRPSPIVSALTLPIRGVMAAWGALSPTTRKIAMDGLGVGHVVGAVTNRFSHLHEFEADIVGLEYMHKAGFDIHEAPALWRRMMKKLGPQLSDSLDSHPEIDDRIERLEKKIAEIEAREGAK